VSDLIRARYEPIELVGRGGQGEVLKARDHQHGRIVALKVREAGSGVDRDRLLAEARILLSIAPHMHLPLVRDDFFEGDRYYLVMDWIDGEDLARGLSREGNGLPPHEVLGYLEQAATALDHLHTHRPPVVHRDVKPANLIRTAEGTVVLVDLGISSARASEPYAGGTPGYRAPELANEPSPGARADVYSLAATAFTLLTGERPRAGTTAWDRLPIGGVAERTIRRALSTDPAKRPHSASAFVEELRAWLAPALPEGRVTFLLTDVEGSVRSWEHAPEAMARALARHDEILATTIGRHGGVLMKTKGEGDSAFAVFPHAPDAVAAAMALQRALLREQWPTPTPLRVRAALHTGEAETRGGDYFGPVVNRAARLRAIAFGGQTIMSGPTHDLVRDRLPAGAAALDHGEHRLRDLARAERVYEVRFPELTETFPSLRSLDARPHNLPVQLTAFVGREHEIAEIRMLLDQHRLVTLTGAGGVGKTRLALQVAAEVVADVPGGAWFVDLAPLDDPAEVLDAIANALGIQPEPGEPLLDTVLGAVSGRELLLALDNCEHLLTECARLATALLARSADLRIIATSREALAIAPEASWRVPSLVLPGRGGLAAVESSDAGRLFLNRARLVASGFEPGEGDAVAIAQICERLDGLPLAIELAAAHADVLTCGQIAARLDDSFRFLTGGSRTSLERQQTMRAAVDWSYTLLDVHERILFRRLAVFSGGFTLEACEHVCAGGEIESVAVLDLIAGLVRQSLVVMEPRSDGARYRLLATIRQYAREKLFESGEAPEVRDAHLAWCAAVAAEAELGLEGPEQARWLARLDDENDNLRAALEWATSNDPCAGMAIVAGVRWFWIVRARWEEGRRWAEHLLAAGCADEHRSARASEALALQLLLELDLPAAERAYTELIERARALGDEVLEVRALSGLAEVASQGGRADEVRALTAEALQIARRLGDLRQIAHIVSEQATVAPDAVEGRRLLREAIEAARAAGDHFTTAIMLNELAVHEALIGDYRTAASLAEDALDLARALHDPRLIVTGMRVAAHAAFRRGEHAEARRLFAELAVMQRTLGGTARTGHAVSFEGMVAMFDGDLRAARARFEEALALLKKAEVQRHVVTLLPMLAEVCALQGDHVAARDHLIEAAEGADRAGTAGRRFEALVGLAREERALGGPARALEVLADALAQAPAEVDPAVLAEGLETLACLVAPPEDPPVLLGAADGLRSATGAPVQPHRRQAWEADVAKIRAACEPGFDDGVAAGRAMSAEAAVVLARRCVQGL